MRNTFTSLVWIAALGLAATVSIIAAQAPQPPAGGRGGAQTPPPAGGGRSRGGVMGAGPGMRLMWMPRWRIQEERSGRPSASTATARRRAAPKRPEPDAVARGAARSLRQRARTVPQEGPSDAERQAASTLTDAQIVNLAHFLRQRVNDTLRGSPIFQVQNVLTGDAKAGAAYFNGAGKCATCHSRDRRSRRHRRRGTSRSIIQQRFLFPGGGRGGAAGAAAAAPPRAP